MAQPLGLLVALLQKVNAHFHETLVQNQFSMLTIQYKPLITERVIIDIEAGLGASMAGAKMRLQMRPRHHYPPSGTILALPINWALGCDIE